MAPFSWRQSLQGVSWCSVPWYTVELPALNTGPHTPMWGILERVSHWISGSPWDWAVAVHCLSCQTPASPTVQKLLLCKSKNLTLERLCTVYIKPYIPTQYNVPIPRSQPDSWKSIVYILLIKSNSHTSCRVCCCSDSSAESRASSDAVCWTSCPTALSRELWVSSCPGPEPVTPAHTHTHKPMDRTSASYIHRYIYLA